MSAPNKWHRKDLLDIVSLSKEEIEFCLSTAHAFKEVAGRPIKKVPALRGKIVVNVFLEPSTRTRISFELAAKALSADVVTIYASGSSVDKGEGLLDTAMTLVSLQADVIVLRHKISGAAATLAAKIPIHVINAGDGKHAHPTQALLDSFTVAEHKKKIKGLSVLIVGDILHSRVARSNIWCFSKLGARVTLCGPPPLMPMFWQSKLKDVEFSYNLDKCLPKADVIILLRQQKERQGEGLLTSHSYAASFGINNERLVLIKKDALIMHPGPIHRGIELTEEVFQDPRCLVQEQVTNGLAVRMAMLYLLAGS